MKKSVWIFMPKLIMNSICMKMKKSLNFAQKFSNIEKTLNFYAKSARIRNLGNQISQEWKTLNFHAKNWQFEIHFVLLKIMNFYAKNYNTNSKFQHTLNFHAQNHMKLDFQITANNFEFLRQKYKNTITKRRKSLNFKTWKNVHVRHFC